MIPQTDTQPTTGTPSLNSTTSRTASTLSTASSSAVTQTGTITSVTSSRITIKAPSPYGYVPVYYSGSTSIAGSLKVGYYASVTGTGAMSGPITASSISASASAPSASSGGTTQTGKITSVSSDRIIISAGSPYGNVPVYYSSSTSVSGPLTVGYYAKVNGSGSMSGPITAGSIVTSSSPTTLSTVTATPATTQTGKITAAASGRITIYAGSGYGYVPVYYSGSTSISGPLTVGSYVTVKGSGSMAGPITASSISTSSSSSTSGSSSGSSSAPSTSMTHLITADYLGITGGNTTLSYSTAARYLTWAQTSTSKAPAIRAAGIKTQYYVDPNRESTGDPMMPSDTAGYARSCGGTAVTTYYGSLLRYVTNPADSTYRSKFSSYTSSLESSGFDLVFDDDAEQPGAYGSYAPGLPCSYSDSSWTSNEISLIDSSRIPVLVNDLNALNGHNVSLVMNLVKGASQAMGGSFENCYASTSAAEQNDWVWTATENSEIQVNGAGKTFMCLARWPGSASSSTASRLFVLASFLLTYNPNTNIFWEQYATPSNFHVMPESQLVALNPLVSAPSDISGLQKNGSTYGAYAREYADCYYAGTYVGPCAAVVNPDRDYSHPFPLSGYKHTLALSGNGVVDGGSASVYGSAPPSTLAPLQGVIVFKN